MRTILRGLVAGAVGTAAMTAVQELVQERDGDGGDTGGDPWESASAPAKVARRALGVVGIDVGEERIPLLTHAMHWGYGTAWGAAFALLRVRSRGDAVRDGVAFGVGVWAMSYAQLVPLGLYEPPWRYPLKTLAVDVGYHLAYGAVTGGSYAALGR